MIRLVVGTVAVSLGKKIVLRKASGVAEMGTPTDERARTGREKRNLILS